MENKEEKEKKISVEKTVLENILSRVELQDEKITELEKKNKMLEYAADKNRIETYRDQNTTPGELIRTVNVGYIDEEGKKKYIVSWGKMVSDEVFYNANGTGVDNQIMKITLHGGGEKIMKIIDFVRNIKREKGEITESRKIEKGEERGQSVLKIQLEDGQELEINSVFVNI